MFVNNQLDAQCFFMYVYFYSLHVSGSHVPIIRRINCIWWAHFCPKHVEIRNKITLKGTEGQFGYLQILYQDVRSREHKKEIIHFVYYLTRMYCEMIKTGNVCVVNEVRRKEIWHL